jgi:hypothetical protein
MKRIPGVDLFKIIGVIAVITLHVTSLSFPATRHITEFSNPLLIANQAARFAVPYFFGILLGKEDYCRRRHSADVYKVRKAGIDCLFGVVVYLSSSLRHIWRFQVWTCGASKDNLLARIGRSKASSQIPPRGDVRPLMVLVGTDDQRYNLRVLAVHAPDLYLINILRRPVHHWIVGRGICVHPHRNTFCIQHQKWAV